MYLTKIKMPIEFDDYKIHQELKNIFEKNNFLFQRQNDTFYQQSDNVLVLSDNKLPDSKDVSGLIDNFKQGLFTLRVVAAIRSSKTRRERPRPIGQVEEWLKFRLREDAGVEASFLIKPEGYRVSYKEKENRTITKNSVFVTGEITVIDSNLFKETLNKGIGKASFIGFGMINIFEPVCSYV